MNLPKEFIANMRSFFENSNEMQDFLSSYEEKRHYGIRANLLKIDAPKLKEIFCELEPVPWCDTGFYYTSKSSPSKSPLYQAGLYYIQEPSAMSAASILDVQPGEKVLDLCASPGGKSTQMAGALAGQGLLVANDATRSRIPQLVKNIETAGISNIMILNEQPEKLARFFMGYFDKILVDAPCSGEGMFRKDPEAILAWDKNKTYRLAAIQKEILRHAAKMLRSGGYLVYSTCTFSRIENEDVIKDFLEHHPDFNSVSINCEKYGVSPSEMGTARLWPHKHRGEGHFIALLHKNTDGFTTPLHETFVAPKFSNKYYDKFCEKYLINPPGRLFNHKDRLLSLPQYCPQFSGLNVVRLGLHVGFLQKQRFTPSYALAMALKKADFAPSFVIDLAAQNPLVERYKGGETFEVGAQDGYCLFCADGFPLGFAKVLNGRLKGRINGR